MTKVLMRHILGWLAVTAIILPASQSFVIDPRCVRTFGYRDGDPLAALITTTEGSSSSSSSTTTPTLESCLAILTRAAETKAEDSEVVLQALLDLEKLARVEAKKQDSNFAQNVLDQLNGSWRLIFTTGTKTTQDKFGRINYFPIKAVQSFDTAKMAIENGIYAGDFCMIKFSGDFEFDLKKRKLEFDFTKLTLLQLVDLSIGRGQAAQLGAKSGLGSESNVANAAKDKKAFFNWISANADIATARGGGGGLALWKRIA